MEKLDFTLLEAKDIDGREKLSIIDKYESRTAITDFAILLGGFVGNYYTKECQELEDRAGLYCTKTYNSDIVDTIAPSGAIVVMYAANRIFGIRPVLPYSSIIGTSTNEVVGSFRITKVEYGEYPQMIADIKTSFELEKLYNEGKLIKTGKEYTTDSVNYDEYNKLFEKRKHIEYEYNGKKYIRILGDYNSEDKQLSDGRYVEYGEPYYIKVEPIVWMIDKDRDKAVSKKLLFAGIQFCDYGLDYTDDFNSTRIKWFLDNYFRKDIIPSKTEKELIETIVPYLVKYDGADETYGAFEIDGILRDIVTSFELVNKSSRKSKNVLKYDSKKKITFKVLNSYCIKDMNKNERLEYVKRICELGKNSKLYQMYSKQIEEEESKEEVKEYVRKLRNNSII